MFSTKKTKDSNSALYEKELRDELENSKQKLKTIEAEAKKRRKK
jgi:hypothetical protein